MLEAAGFAGAFAGGLLADGGADVVRVVAPEGDALDREPPYFGGSGVSIQAAWYNAGKRIATLDARSASGRAQILDLVAGADILIEDWPPNAPVVATEDLAAANPSLVRVSVTPFGQHGPWAVYRVNDLVANALAGPASITGNAETPPLTGYGNQGYHTAGLYATVCALAALRAARASGQAQHVDLSVHEALYSCTEQIPMQWFFPQPNWPQVAPRQGSLHWSGAYEVYPDREGRGLMVTVVLRFIDSMLGWLQAQGAEDNLGDRQKYPDVLAYYADIAHVMQVMREWVARNDAMELFFQAQRERVPLGVVLSIPEVAQSPQIAARRYIQPVEVSGFGRAPMPGRLFRTGADAGHPAPARRVDIAAVGWDKREPPSPEGGAPGSAPLAGIRILDLTHVLAGPFGTRLLGDLGAEVIKLGSAARAGGAAGPAHPYYVCWNRNKRSIMLDLRSADGRRLAQGLAAKCDVVIENFVPGVLARLGLDRESLAGANPGISVVSMGGMGQDGPWRDFVTFAPTIHALTGLTYLTNPLGRHDLGLGFSLTDHLSGLAGALACLEAVEYRRRTGSGLSIDLAQYEVGLGLVAPGLIDHLVNGTNPEPLGNRHPFAAWAPHGIYRCAGEDRWVAIAVRGDEEWARLCEVMGQPGRAREPRFAGHEARIKHQDELDAAVESWTGEHDRYEVMARCQAAGLAAGTVQDAADLATCDPQLAAREFFGSATSASRGEYGLDRFPAWFNGRPIERYEGVRELGADTFAVLSDVLGMGDEEIARLASEGVLS